MQILLREFKAHGRSLLIWGGIVILILAMASVEFDAFRDLANVDEMLAAFPAEFRAAFSFDVVRFDQPEGYYSYLAQFFMMMPVLYAVLAGCRLLSREISRRTAETTFTLPVRRRYMITMKLINALIQCLLLTIIIVGASAAVFARFDVSRSFYRQLIQMGALILLLQGLFLCAGLAASVWTKAHKRIATIMSSVTMALFIMTFIANLSESYDFLRYITPFEFFPAIDVMHGYDLPVHGLIITPVLTVGFLVLALYGVERKDIL